MKTAAFLTMLTLAGVLASGSVGQAEDEHSVDSASASASLRPMTSLYTGDGQLGAFSGKLVCLRCDLAHSPGGAEVCEKSGHRHALSMDDGSMIHPLLAGTKEIQEQINSNALHGKEVRVSGKHYLSTGLIFVSQVVQVE